MNHVQANQPPNGHFASAMSYLEQRSNHEPSTPNKSTRYPSFLVIVFFPDLSMCCGDHCSPQTLLIPYIRNSTLSLFGWVYNLDQYPDNSSCWNHRAGPNFQTQGGTEGCHFCMDWDNRIFVIHPVHNGLIHPQAFTQPVATRR